MKPQLNKALEYIAEHLADELTLGTIASSTGYSPYHFAREFKVDLGLSVMEYVTKQRLEAAKTDLAKGRKVIDTALERGFDTHAGFTKAFGAEFGCTPKEYAAHAVNMKGAFQMKEDSKIIIRAVCEDDVNDLWENVYSAMTPRQITEGKILPSIEREKQHEGVELVAQVDGTVVMSLPMIKPFWIPVGFLFDNYFNWAEGDNNLLMRNLIDGMKRFCKMMSITTLISPQETGSEPVKAFEALGFINAFSSGGWDYLMLAV